MSPSNTMLTGAITEVSPNKSTAVMSQAQRGAMLTIIREGTPRQVAETLNKLEASGDVGQDEDILQDDVSADEVMPEMDADVELGDEDEPVREEWEDEGAALGAEDVSLEPQTNPFSPQRFEIVVTPAGCTVPIDERFIRRARSSVGQLFLYELESRFWALGRTAAWLTERRGEFLRSRDLWHLGCEALDDVKNGRTPVEQKSFLSCSGMEEKVSEASFSRYIRATDLAWSDASGPLDILFSDAAKRMWVANAVRQFIEETGEAVTEELLDEYASVSGKRGSGVRSRLAGTSSGAMDIPTLIQKANMMAGTKWQDVVSSCRERLLGESR